ncbi:MAG TPA: HNH endonuclease, partial [Planctomycetaceae bacterium]|nr:HNH endonuclease [Planctomycetaceae bacterium]
MAIRIIDVRRALTLLYRDCAEVITVEDGSYVNYDFRAWCEIGPLLALEKQPDEEYIQAV